MKRLNRSRFTLSVCVAAVFLTGCDGSQPASVAPGAVRSNTMQDLASRGNFRSNSLDDEMLTASSVKIVLLYGTNCSERPGPYYFGFSTSGNASGFINGTFSAEGGWSFGPLIMRLPWSFVESFTITAAKGGGQVFGVVYGGSSRHQKGPGFSCSPPTISNASVKYRTIDGAHDAATVYDIKANNFSETLTNL